MDIAVARIGDVSLYNGNRQKWYPPFSQSMYVFCREGHRVEESPQRTDCIRSATKDNNARQMKTNIITLQTAYQDNVLSYGYHSATIPDPVRETYMPIEQSTGP